MIRRIYYLKTIVLLAVLLSANGRAAADSALPEYQVKAAIVYKVAKFVYWPEYSFPSGSSPVVMCIAGKDPFGQFIDDLNGRAIHGRPMIVRRVELSDEAVRRCHIVFLGESTEENGVLQAIAQRPVLTIGDSKDFAESGGILGLTISNNRVVFEINLEVARAAELNISASLLQLATIVESPAR